MDEKKEGTKVEQLFIVHILANSNFQERWVAQVLGKGNYRLAFKKDQALKIDKGWANQAASDLNGVVEPIK